MKRFFTSVLALTLALSSAAFFSVHALAVGGLRAGAAAARGADQPAELFGDTGVVSQISSILLFIVGIVAVIMIVVGGFRYIISGGDASQVQAAKNTILYALVGVIIAILAYAIVNFVMGVFLPGGSGLSGFGSDSASYGASTR